MAGPPRSADKSPCQKEVTMFAKLLQLAADKNLIVGMCVHPRGAFGYQVEIWTGPSMGERTECYERFSCDIPPMEALDRVAAIAVERHCATKASAGNLRAFFLPAPGPGQVDPQANLPTPGDFSTIPEMHRTS